jgi:hypothetical protein
MVLSEHDASTTVAHPRSKTIDAFNDGSELVFFAAQEKTFLHVDDYEYIHVTASPQRGLPTIR